MNKQDKNGTDPYLVLPPFDGDFNNDNGDISEAVDELTTMLHSAVFVHEEKDAIVILVSFGACSDKIHGVSQIADLDYAMLFVTHEIYVKAEDAGFSFSKKDRQKIEQFFTKKQDIIYL